MTSTNLAHTAPYCLPTSPGTMAERYHKTAFCNSTLVLTPMFPSHLLPGLETIVIPLANDLSFPELQKHRKKGLHLPSSRNGSKGDSQRSDPLNLQRHPVMVRYLLFYLIHLTGHVVRGTGLPLV